MADTFILSIEPVEGETFIWSSHLGTDEKVARNEAERIFHARNQWAAGSEVNGHIMATRTVALKRGKDGTHVSRWPIFDVYDGKWSSQCDDYPWDEYAETQGR